MTAGSPWVPANLNEHSLFNDTEINIATCDPMLARHTRLALWAEHLDRTVEEIDHDPNHVIDGLWRPIAEEQVHRRSNGLALTHRLMQLPAVSRRAMMWDPCEASSSTADRQGCRCLSGRSPARYGPIVGG